MSEHDEEQIRRILRPLLSGSKPATRAACIDEEMLARYLGGDLSEGEKLPIEAHLASCSFCVEEIVALHRLAGTQGTERVPQHLIDRAMALVRSAKPQETMFDLVVRVVRDSIELVRTSGQWMNPAAAAPIGVRGKSQPFPTSILQVEKQIGELTASVEVELVETGECHVVVGVKDRAGKAVDNIRVSLLSEGREQASYLTLHGEALFDHIPKGEYNLALSQSANPLGTIRLRLEEDDHE